ncbi:ArsR/SmtB family transcription factor [Aromatoleum petrolei]|uniref:Helix-turn-helix domain-containing protein n=1 Tax=Aromatoleum petrolei TaxID=76116 RepID=A0ABX1MMB0_9RHOO|nr:metalloregulator ArsR/SmtB family transcription factor [Aromatoleum petrolei]NMF89089.1 helix-turn-helix domain-containing protein [Aromatoleum petrolei]QTQ38319.1 Transcriptional regulator, ArsR family [Aromatoleum petrolei]
MDEKIALAVFECLSSSVRLGVFRLLVKAEPAGVVAGDIAAALDIAPSSLSFHLRTMTQAGLIGVEQEGRFLRYRANLALMTEVVGFLTENCCSGVPGGCRDADVLSARISDCGSRNSRQESKA